MSGTSEQTDQSDVQAVLIEKGHGGYLVYHDGAVDFDFVDRLRINGYHASANDSMELEAHKVNIEQTGPREKTAQIRVVSDR